MENNKAFTLIELSVVIVIIGLIVAGIVAGQSLVRQAQFRSMVSELRLFESAYNTFKLQYDALPGDMNNFSSYVSGSNDGDGNKLIRYQDNEDHYLLEHLSKSDLIDGNFTGSLTFTPGLGTYKSSLKNTHIVINHTTDYFDQQGNIINFVGVTPINSAIASGPEAQALDLKIDDSTPHKGRMVVNAGAGLTAGTDCMSHAITEPATTNITYIVSKNDMACRIYYFIDHN